MPNTINQKLPAEPGTDASLIPETHGITGFHPAVQRWFAGKFRRPVPVQERGWEAIRTGRHTLISAPTGSGKTLTAFLNTLDELLREGEANGGSLPDETRVLYVSPLKALSADIHKNLAEPRREIRQVANEMGIEAPRITAAVRSGDTPSAERQAMLKKPPHLLVTTPESLYLLLTTEKGRKMLSTVRTVIVDEIHAIVESRRGSHLALTLERLAHVAGHPLQRIGLSATQKPVEEVARFLVGTTNLDENDNPNCIIIDEGHSRPLDLQLELTDSPLEAVMSGEMREELYDRLAALIKEHKTTLVFVNTRREAERTAHYLGKRLDEGCIMAHHGSLSKDARLEAERRLKEGSLSALVATASLELGIDIGHVDLACQIGSPHRISTFLQRVGRSGHTVEGTPKGRLFPLTRNELVECTALLWCVTKGELDRIIIPAAPLDILSQQIVAEVACENWDEASLFNMLHRAYPYRNLSRNEFDEIVQMLSRGFTTQKGRRGARIHYDAINRRLHGRRGSRLAALTSGGAIPDNADYRVILEPEETFIGTVDEDFAVESMPGNVFQLGSSSWRILRIQSGTVRVEDARGQPPGIPFWFGEAPSRSPELSAAVSELRREVELRLEDSLPDSNGTLNDQCAIDWLAAELRLSQPAALQIVEYLAETKRLLGVIPTQKTLVLERFFDQAGDMQLVLHAPFGSRINRAWGLALRKRFCRQFNFELQAVATEEGVLLSLGPQHSFPLDDVFRYLHPNTVGNLLVQALLDAPMFQTRWRWNATMSLAMLRWRSGGKVAPQLQRMQAEDLLVSVFPDAAACLENIAGDREVPDHPLVRQTIRDCLEEVMDLHGLEAILQQVQAGDLKLVACDTPEPSALAHELLTANPYAFLDDAPLEERRTRAVYTRRSFEPSSGEQGILDLEAIQRVRDEAWPRIENADELHDSLLTFGFLTDEEIQSRNQTDGQTFFRELQNQGRVIKLSSSGSPVLWIAAENLQHALLIWPDASGQTVPHRQAAQPRTDAGETDPSESWKELLRSRMALMGPVTVAQLAAIFGTDENKVNMILHALESEGTILRGHFTPGTDELEWCDRHLLARIHRYTLERLRAEIQPVSRADFMRFLFEWQRVLPDQRVAGEEGLMSVLEQLEGIELPAAAWETEVLPSRCNDYSPEYLDHLCTSGRITWGRITLPSGNGQGLQSTGPIRSSPIALWKRDDAGCLLQPGILQDPGTLDLSFHARDVLEMLQKRGASFFHDLVSGTRLLPSYVEMALGELAAFGLVTSDSFSGLRALLVPVEKRHSHGGRRHKHHGKTAPFGVDTAGRWSLVQSRIEQPEENRSDEYLERWAWLLLRRYGIVFHRLLAREASAPPWRDLIRFYWRLEARGEVRGGRFVNGFSGEQFALTEAVGLLRNVRKEPPNETILTISAADPLNLTGIITPGHRVPSVVTNRIGYRNGVPEVALESGEARNLNDDEAVPYEIEKALRLRRIPDELRAFIS